MILQLLPSEFPYIWGKFYFLFHQCALSFKGGIYPHHRNEVTGETELFVVTNLTLLIRTWPVCVRLSQTARQFHQSGVRIFNMLEMICLAVFAVGKIFWHSAWKYANCSPPPPPQTGFVHAYFCPKESYTFLSFRWVDLRVSSYVA